MTAVSAPAKTGNGATITFSTSPHCGYTGKIVRIDGLSEAIEALDWSDLSTTGQQKLITADLKTIDPIEVETRWDASQYSEMKITPDSSCNCVITMPVWAATGSTGGSIQGSGFVVGTTTPTLENNVVGTGSFTFQFDGVTALTVTPEDTT